MPIAVIKIARRVPKIANMRILPIFLKKLS